MRRGGADFDIPEGDFPGWGRAPENPSALHEKVSFCPGGHSKGRGRAGALCKVPGPEELAQQPLGPQGEPAARILPSLCLPELQARPQAVRLSTLVGLSRIRGFVKDTFALWRHQSLIGRLDEVTCWSAPGCGSGRKFARQRIHHGRVVRKNMIDLPTGMVLHPAKWVP